VLERILKISRIKKQLIMLLFDSSLLVLILLASFSIRLGYWFWPQDDLIWVIAGAPIIAIPIFTWLGLYHSIIRFLGLQALWAVVKAVTLYALIWGVIGFMSAVEGIPRSVMLINWLLAVMTIGGSRMLVRWTLSDSEYVVVDKKSVIIYGAGSAGRQLAVALLQSREYKLVAFIDDDKGLIKQYVNSVKVYSPDDIELLIQKNSIDEILLALPSETRQRNHEIFDLLEPYPVLVRILPSVSELAQGKVKVDDLREVSVKDLLGRDTVKSKKELLSSDITNKTIIVTGAGGSIGSELCRQIVCLNPKALILYEMNELALYNVDKELSNIGIRSIDIYPILGSVNNRNRLNSVFKRFKVDTIYHAAAYKHVPMVEFNNTEGVENNIFGTLNCAQAAIDNGVETFVLISTDKAVRPTNTMGATKRSAELILQALSAKQSGTKFTIVRFGNVLDSSGSVIPLFKQQIKEGGPVTVTDINIIRYFMTIPEAVELVIQAGFMGVGGDVFVLDMGKPIKIYDLARKMIHLTGLEVKDEFNPEGDIEIQITGLRPGEKLYEELLISGSVAETDHPLIMCAQEDMLAWDELELILYELDKAAKDYDQELLRSLLIKIVPNFQPQCGIEDILYQK
jgi:FlaA1/EpsC-like NDP-sugar epimerase